MLYICVLYNKLMYHYILNNKHTAYVYYVQVILFLLKNIVGLPSLHSNSTLAFLSLGRTFPEVMFIEASASHCTHILAQFIKTPTYIILWWYRDFPQRLCAYQVMKCTTASGSRLAF